MQEDLAVKREFERTYPGTIMTVRYEDFVLSTAQTIKGVFEFIRRPPPVGIYSWVWNAMHGQQDNGHYGTVRANSLTLVDSWKGKVTYRDGTIMNSNCKDVLENLGYEL